MRVPRIVFRRDRSSRAITVGVLVAVLYSMIGIAPSIAAADRVYADSFPADGDYSTSTGSDPWSGPWIESGDDGSAASGAIAVTGDGHCADGACLLIGKEGVDSASITRHFDSSGGSSVTLSFRFLRHVHSAGLGEVKVSGSTDGSSFTTVATYSLAIDDPDQILESLDLSGFAGAGSAIRFELSGGADDTHMNVDDLLISVSGGSTPVFDQDLADRTDAEGSDVSFSAAATDLDGDPLDYAATGLPPGVVIDPGSGFVSGTIEHSAAASSPYAVEITATDPDGKSAVDTFTWTVDDVNLAPTASDRSATVEEDDAGGVAIDLLDPGFVADLDGDPLTVASLDLASLVGGTVSDNGDGTVRFTPDPDFDQTSLFDYTVADGRGGEATATVTVAVTGTPDDPGLDPIAPVTVSEGAIAGFTASAQDPDSGESLRFGLVDGPDPVPDGAVIDADTGVFSWPTAEEDGPGSYAFTVRVEDSTGRIADSQVSVTVEESNAVPIVGSLPDRSDSEGAAVSFSVPVTDEDVPKGELEFAAVGLPAGITIHASSGVVSGTISYSAATGQPYEVTITVSDDHVPPGVDDVTFEWTIMNSNRPPTFVSQPPDLAAREGDSISVTVMATDPDGDGLTYQAVGLPAGLSIDATTGAISGVLADGSAGAQPYVVEVRVSDQTGGSAAVTIEVMVDPQPAPATTTTTTTTTMPPSTTTTTEPSHSTTTTSPTTTTAPPSTTTTLEESTASVTTTTTPSAGMVSPVTTGSTKKPGRAPSRMSAERAVEVKSGLVFVERGVDSEISGERGRASLDPREGLTVTFASAVEALRSQFLSAAALGIAIAFLLMLGVDEREPRQRRRATAN